MTMEIAFSSPRCLFFSLSRIASYEMMRCEGSDLKINTLAADRERERERENMYILEY
jgi:hypothetical protein